MTAQHALVLFDLDGTLIDSAPDLAGAANAMRVARGMEALPVEALRPMVGAGARGMVRLAFGVSAGRGRAMKTLRSEFLDRYEHASLVHTAVFDGVHPVLDQLDARGRRWGIVTNKAERFTHRIVEGLGLAQRAAVVVCGDTTPHSKPHPAPLLEAARRAGATAGGLRLRRRRRARHPGRPCGRHGDAGGRLGLSRSGRADRSLGSRRRAGRTRRALALAQPGLN